MFVVESDSLFTASNIDMAAALFRFVPFSINAGHAVSGLYAQASQLEVIEKEATVSLEAENQWHSHHSITSTVLCTPVYVVV
jgi:hypothetical protein